MDLSDSLVRIAGTWTPRSRRAPPGGELELSRETMPMETDPRSSTNAPKPRGLRLWRKKDDELAELEDERVVESRLWAPRIGGKAVAITDLADIPGLLGGG